MVASPTSRSGRWHALLLLLVGLTVGLLGRTWAEDASAPWQPAQGPLMTRWAAEVSPTNVHPEYPRPQLTRSQWLNLNGLWDYAIVPNFTLAVTNYDGQILVPFPVESALSGVKRPLDGDHLLWYHRTFHVPPEWAGQRIRLHFGAVDWRTQVIVNGQEVGQHRGGYDGFSFDITDRLHWQGTEDLEVIVYDATEGDQICGKQIRNPEGIFYTSSSGIWQTVWLEPVPQTCIDRLTLVPDVDASVVRVTAEVNHPEADTTVEVTVLAAGQRIVSGSGAPNEVITLPLPNPHLWSPADPFLYDLRVELKNTNGVGDAVGSYFGMRKIALQRDDAGVTKIALNNKIEFELGTLDQGFWPDGLYTAPTDAALRYDIEFLKQAGFNLTRKHVKVEPERWYYWCDKLGLLVWQDMPSGNNQTPEARTQFEAELQQMITGRRNHPCIVTWILFNEGWGQYDTERLVSWVKTLDPSRLVDNVSGWTDKRVGDIFDIHVYPGPEAPPPESDRATVLGEFGGLGLGVPQHTWSAKYWGYQPMTNATVLADNYRDLLDRVHLLDRASGLSAAIYTQTTDVETECNGLMTYDRAVAKIPPETLRAANQETVQEQPFRALAADALFARVTWKYTFDKPDDSWVQPDFNDANWRRGIGGFGTTATPSAIVNTVWNTSDIWLRREFTLTTGDVSSARIQIHHDEDAEVYFNGVLAAKVAGFSTDYELLAISPEAAATLKPGENLITVHCHQTSGGQFIDAGIVVPKPGASATSPQP
ncbi:MAG TPA: glycoside hydrolase family 2 TIM barrel-domain containing protein [Dongiaceae bacterium]|nr:glycoside hydrolase family 2 TIM barrel-domain containing protein [Dongiaceae bacterium]